FDANVLSVGPFQKHIFLLQLNAATGTGEWVKAYHARFGTPEYLSLSPNDEIDMLMRLEGTSVWGGDTLGLPDPMVSHHLLHFDSQGSYRWSKQLFLNNSIQKLRQLSEDNMGSIYISGEFENLQLDNIDLQNNVPQSFLARLETSLDTECSNPAYIKQQTDVQFSHFHFDVIGSPLGIAFECTPGLNPTQEAWFAFEATTKEPVIQLKGSGDLSVEIYDQCGSATALACTNQLTASTIPEVLTDVSLIIGETYFLRVLHLSGGKNFGIAVHDRPEQGLTPCTAIPIQLDSVDNQLYSNVIAHTGSYPLPPAPSTTNCFSNQEWCPGEVQVVAHPIWFSFVAPAGKKVSLFTFESTFNPQIAVYRGNQCGTSGGFDLVAANDDGFGIDQNVWLDADCLVPGETYYVMVDGRDQQIGQFGLANWTSSGQNAPSADFAYQESSYCFKDPNPVANIQGLSGGSFSANSQLLSFANANTGEVNLALSQPGTYTIYYTVDDGTCENVSYQQLTIEGCFQPGSGNASVSIFPNPGTDNVNLMIPGHSAARVQIRMLDMQGKVILQASKDSRGAGFTHSLATQHLPAGLYLIETQLGTETYTNRWIKR
ncbi:MAG: T9SS type A sorting domain-containing protein, partial [Bacteroidota bacterium]